MRGIANGDKPLFAIWPQPSTIPLVPPDRALRRVELSQMMLDARVVHKDVLEELYAEINEKYGSNFQLPE